MSMYDPFGFNERDKHRDNWQKKARNLYLPGIDPADLKPGDRVTISPNLRYEDNSYTNTIHTVLAVNSINVQTRLDKHWSNDPIILNVNDHHFYSAAGFESMK